MVGQVRADIKKLWNSEKAEFLQRFFSVEDRARGDMFRGLTVPQSRIIAKKYRELHLKDIQELLSSGVHEERLIALLILVDQFKKGNDVKKKEIFNFYLENTEYINHWDLVDSSAHQIIGEFLIGKPKDILYKLAKSKIWWERRIAVIATYAFILKKETKDTFKIAEVLIDDKHDLIQKAVGWMLREAGKRVSENELLKFLGRHYKQMPRTMLRYSIEKFREELRKSYLKGSV